MGKPSSHSNFNIWFGKLEIFFTTMYTKQIIRKQFVRHFRATWLIRYVEMAKSIFTSSKHWFAGVNFPPGNKNWQCTAITTMQIKQKQAQFTPDQNCTSTICYPNDPENLHTTKIVTTAWINQERMPITIEQAQNSRNKRGVNFPSRSKTLTVCTCPKF